MMKPILFNTHMVRAILDGRKTVTRRPIKGLISCNFQLDGDGSLISYHDRHCGECIDPIKLAPYRVGDVLYVRETWGKGIQMCGGICYKADGNNFLAEGEKWKPSIHMPKEVARLFLKVADVRIERLKDITDAEAMKEGFESADLFISAWDEIYKNAGMNPWVWVIEWG